MSVRQRDEPRGPAPVSVRSEPPALLSLRGLRVHFETKRGESHAVDDVSFDIHDGETLGLVGETGSGKTMTARSLLRLVPRPPGIYAGGQVLFRPKITCPRCTGTGCPECEGTGRVGAPCPQCAGSGCLECEGTGIETIDLLMVSERRIRRIRGNHIAMISQDPGKALNPALSIRQQLAEVFAEHRADELLRDAGIDPEKAGPLLRRDARRRTRFFERRLLSLPPFRAHHRRLRAVIDERIARALADTRIPNPPKVMQKYPHELSGGMKQRVMIAQALAANPELLIADEPTTALDVTIQARILDLLAELQERHHAAVLYISHDLSLVRRISDRVAVMYAGQLIEVGPADTILSRPMHPYSRGLLGAIPTTRHRKGKLIAIEGTVPELLEVQPMCRFSGRCPYAAPICKSREPTLEAHNIGHRVACFLYDSAENLGVAPEDMPTRGDA